MKERLPLVVVTPVLEDRASAAILMRGLSALEGLNPYVIVVEDGSVNNPLQITDLTSAGLSGEIIYLARNVGHQRAIACGLVYTASQFDAHRIVVMDADGEDDPASIPTLLEKLGDGVDVVVARRRKRSESFAFRTFYIFYRLFFRICTGRTIRFGSFTALSNFALRRVTAMQEIWVHFAATLMISRLRIRSVAIDRGKRYAGQSRMNLVSLILHGFRSMMVFAEDVLVRVGFLCVVLASIALVLMVIAAILKLVGFATPGWFSTATGILVLILMQAGALSFVTLMVAGVVRSASPLSRTQLEPLIDHISKGRAESKVVT
jgi:glycosyltransferase involved in cell wall biosynthesis